MAARFTCAEGAPIVVGFLGSQAPPRSNSAEGGAIVEGFRDNGLIYGRDYVFEERFTGGDDDRFPTFAYELAQKNARIIMTNPVTWILLALLTFTMMTDAASAQQRTFYDSRGNVVGRSSTDSSGTTTNYDARGRVISRESTSGNTTTIYDAGGRNAGRFTTSR